jgi:hypothetical protein
MAQQCRTGMYRRDVSEHDSRSLSTSCAEGFWNTDRNALLLGSRGLHPTGMAALERAKKEGRKFQNPVETRIGGVCMLLKVLRLYKTNKEERVPRRALGPFRTNARVYEIVPTSGLRVTWIRTLLDADRD